MLASPIDFANCLRRRRRKHSCLKSILHTRARGFSSAAAAASAPSVASRFPPALRLVDGRAAAATLGKGGPKRRDGGGVRRRGGRARDDRLRSNDPIIVRFY